MFLTVFLKEKNFNPLPPQGGRLKLSSKADSAKIFQSTPSPRRETVVDDSGTLKKKFQSTPSPRRETYSTIHIHRIYDISIHSLPKEGDCIEFEKSVQKLISIHSLPKEGDVLNAIGHAGGQISIHSLPKEGDS